MWMQPGRVALVTGASRGLGAVIAQSLARDGLRVAVNYHRGKDRAEALANELQQEGAIAEAFGADVTTSEGVDELVAAVTERLGEIEVLVLNATGPQPELGLEETAWEQHSAHLDFFLKSPVLLGNAVLAGMKRRSFGRIVHVGSDVTARPPAAQSAYVAAKSAQLGLARAWALELAPYGITVNTVAPGWIPVERHAGASAATLEGYKDLIPAGRLGEPVDVAEVVRFLASPAAGFVTGQLLYVNGGMVLGS